MKYWQMSFLLVIYIFSYIWYVVVDISFDGIIDMPVNYPLIMLIVIMSFGTIWYGLSRKPHMYVR